MSLFDPMPPEEPAATEEALEPVPVAPERTGRGIPSPWQGRAVVWDGSRHDPATVAVVYQRWTPPPRKWGTP